MLRANFDQKLAAFRDLFSQYSSPSLIACAVLLLSRFFSIDLVDLVTPFLFFFVDIFIWTGFAAVFIGAFKNKGWTGVFEPTRSQTYLTSRFSMNLSPFKNR
jgi:hypothetical protein